LKNFLKAKIKNLLGKTKRMIFSIPNKYGYKLKIKTDIYKLNTKESFSSFTKFDYVIFGIGRIGSKAIQTFINLHPEIFTISRKEVDKYLTGSKIDLLTLHKRYRNKLEWLKSKKIKSVIVIHNNAEIYDKASLKKFCEIANNAILFVRDPFENIKSHYNQGIYNSPKPSGYHLKQWDKIDLLKRNFNKSELDHLNHYLNSKIKNIKYNSISKELKRFFKDLKLLDFTLLRDQNEIQNLFKILGVSEFFHPSFNEPQNDLLQRYFRHNFFKLKIADSFEIKCRFSILENFINSNDEKVYKRLIRLNLKEDISINKKLLKHIDVIFLEEDYQEILLEDRKYLFDKFIDKDLLLDIFDKMIDRIKRVEFYFDKMKNKYNEKYFIRKLLKNKDIILSDIEQFVEIYPEFNHYKEKFISKINEISHL